MKSVVGFVSLLGACASAGGEVGLAPLREVLGLSPRVGHVVREGDDAWLVHDASGVRIARLPGGDGPTCADRDGRAGLVFSGDPGAALTLGLDHAAIWQSRSGCAVSTPMFAPSPTWSPLIALGAAAPMTRLEVPSGAVEVALTSAGGFVRQGDDTVLLDFPSGCSVSAQVERADGPDGATWVRVAYRVRRDDGFDDCADALARGDRNSDATGYVWAEVTREGLLTVVERYLSVSGRDAFYAELTRMVPTPDRGAYLEYHELQNIMFGREGAFLYTEWHWVLVAQLERFVLAESGE